jgi:hypothetical protein
MVQFDDVQTAPPPSAMAGRCCGASRVTDPDALWVHDLIGGRVVDQTGIERGRACR